MLGDDLKGRVNELDGEEESRGELDELLALDLIEADFFEDRPKDGMTRFEAQRGDVNKGEKTIRYRCRVASGRLFIRDREPRSMYDPAWEAGILLMCGGINNSRLPPFATYARRRPNV